MSVPSDRALAVASTALRIQRGVARVSAGEVGVTVLPRRLNLTRDGQEAEVAETTLAETTVAEVLAELAALEDPKAREVNEKHGDDHGVNLSKLRALAKRLKTQQELARQLWETDDTAARLTSWTS